MSRYLSNQFLFFLFISCLIDKKINAQDPMEVEIRSSDKVFFSREKNIHEIYILFNK